MMPIPTPAPKIRFYVDALNFYNGVSRECNIKWIDIEKILLCLVREKIPNATAEKILIFTALVKGNYDGALQRQESYISALQTHSPCIEIILGHFNKVHKHGEVVKGSAVCSLEIVHGSFTTIQKKGVIVRENTVGSFATIKILEEKQTDVNLACRIVEDAYIARENEEKSYDACCLVSNDGDIAYALEVKKRLEQRILLITPITKKQANKKRRRPAVALTNIIPKEDSILEIGNKLVATCILPDTVGKFTKPLKWH